MSDNTRNHQEIWSLLPWLANGRATPEQQQRAQPHLRECSECRAELAREQALAHAFAQPRVRVPDTERGLQALMQRLDQADATTPASTPIPTGSPVALPAGRRHRPTDWRQLAAARLGLGTVATLGLMELLVALVLGWAWLHAPRAGVPATVVPSAAPGAPYRTLTSPEPKPAPAASATPRWRVVFQEQHTLRDLHGLLRSEGLSIMAGPSEIGVYTLGRETAASGTAAEQADAVAQRLRASPLVRFAEAVAVQGTQP